MTYTNIFCVADSNNKSKKALIDLQRQYNFCSSDKNADLIIALGGDGFMLNTIHHYMKREIPIYGINCGTIGFLMNKYEKIDLLEKISNAKIEHLKPLKMTTIDVEGNHHHALAINEVSLLRQTRQAANIKVSVDYSIRLEKLMCDGILVSTAAGSTAYNFSVNGPIIPMGSDLLALTPVSPFRPRRWKGALLPQKAKVQFDIHNPEKRPVSAVADFTEIRNVASVHIEQSTEKEAMVLFDVGHSLEERIISEQFMV